MLLALINEHSTTIGAALGAAGGLTVAHAISGKPAHKYGFAVITAVIVGVATGWIVKHCP